MISLNRNHVELAGICQILGPITYATPTDYSTTPPCTLLGIESEFAPDMPRRRRRHLIKIHFRAFPHHVSVCLKMRPQAMVDGLGYVSVALGILSRHHGCCLLVS